MRHAPLTLVLAAFALGTALFGLPGSSADAKVPYTHRKQVILIPDVVMNTLGAQNFQSVLDQSKVVRKTQDSETLRKVGGHISKVAKEPDFAWRYAMIQDPQVNAWCLPGGYIGFYEGILPVLKNESGMAFVMGHEVGHAIAHHGAERMTANLAIFGGLTGLNAYLTGHSSLSPEQRQILMGALGLGATYGIEMPFSRLQESEADTIGIMLMANAGYPPKESIDIWDRMTAMTGPTGPSFLSDHPANAQRQKNLQDWMARAEKRYERNKLDYDTTATLWTGPGKAEEPIKTPTRTDTKDGETHTSPSGGTLND